MRWRRQGWGSEAATALGVSGLYIRAYVITYAAMATAAAPRTPSQDSEIPAAAGAAAIGSRVRALREAMDLSLRDLAERSGVSAPMLSQVERGETSLTLAV